MRKLLLSTALTLGVSAFALQTPAQADGALGLNDGEALVIAAIAALVYNNAVDDPWGGNGFLGDLGKTRENFGGTVQVYGTIDKDKDKRVVELVLKVKAVVIIVANIFRGKSAAEADLIVDQQNVNNTVNASGQIDPPVLEPPRKGLVELRAVISDSVNDNIGIAQLNQDTGNMVNQANVLAAAVTREGNFVDSQAAAQQDNVLNTVTAMEVVPSGEFIAVNAQKSALIERSVNRNTGVVGVNQNVGNMNNQLNAVSLAVGLEADFALADAALGQFNTNNTVTEQNTIRTATILGSVNFNTGVTGVNQATGNMNNQATVISFAGSAQF